MRSKPVSLTGRRLWRGVCCAWRAIALGTLCLVVCPPIGLQPMAVVRKILTRRVRRGVPKLGRSGKSMSKVTVVIIGGGVTGLSTAYHLALRNFGRIVVVDKGPVGDGSSSRAAGIITGLMWSE